MYPRYSLPSLRSPVPLVITLDALAKDDNAVLNLCDVVIYLTDKALHSTSVVQRRSPLYSFLSSYGEVDQSFESKVSLIVHEKACRRFVYAPVPKTYGDYEDVRTITKRAREALKSAITCGAKRPLFCIDLTHPSTFFTTFGSVGGSFVLTLKAIVYALYQELYVPLEYAQKRPPPPPPSFERLTVSVEGLSYAAAARAPVVASLNDQHFVQRLTAVEQGRILSRDIGGSDPELMSPPQCASYILQMASTRPSLRVDVINDPETLLREYPLLAAVGRCSMATPRHAPCVVRIKYTPPPGGAGVINHVYLVGKGITYDTGGADIKINGAMTGMSRDKCGAAAIAGFMMTVADLQVDGTEYVALLAFVRNSVGADSYVTDEVITARSGVTVRVGNTDAEGRMVMADLICEAKEDILRRQLVAPSSSSSQHNAIILTCATLTGHVVRSYGITAGLVPNAEALARGIPWALQARGEALGEAFEVSRLRREDFEFVNGSASYVDLVSCNTAPSTMTNRGHQFPGAFLIQAAGLGVQQRTNASSPAHIPFVHVDIAAVNDEPGFGRATAFPVLTFVECLAKGREEVAALLRGVGSCPARL